ncbi:tetratricopeptide repeat protein [Actinoplanes sp. LDG1-06]|uniref:Tetratricopeptide repeat protein n=1 Tax=Paractinoplanes ovalisporus TaxID=2810368 RepID=A0ABS2AVM9_9ACTN|nr:tetratricopeptide repeat protein [Actinoplanes ovalisporus]MBM2623770.1 tetratricopeptide repeat protein [Actinoplanes ovalisporus]
MTGDPADPGRARTLDDLIQGLRSLKVWAGDPSYDAITARVNAAWMTAGRPGGELTRKSTLVDCFKLGRRRLNTDLVLAIVRALHPDEGYVAQWRQALRVVSGESEAAAQVRVQDFLPPPLPGFTGRGVEVAELRRVSPRGDTVVISAVEGMAGVGKTQLAVHVGHQLRRDGSYEHVLFVNLRGFHPDPAQPPADPSAVLDGFLRLLGVPGQQIPHELEARTALYRDRLAGTRALLVLDNAATTEQVRPLLPATSGCLALVTSRRRLDGLRASTRLNLDVFRPYEAEKFLSEALPDVPVGSDPQAAARIARRCGHLPLALGLVAAHIRGTPGWTLTDHADRLDERHRGRRLDNGVELALDLSYRHLPAELRRLLRLAASHPGHDLDAYAVAALTGADPPSVRTGLEQLCSDHLLQQAAPGRYTFHDLVRAYAGVRAEEEERPAERNAALTRLFDYYLAAAATAVHAVYPAEAHRRAPIPSVDTPLPALESSEAAVGWLDAERPTLVAVVAHAAAQGRSGHALALANTLYRYLDGGHYADALAVQSHAVHAGRQSGNSAGEAHALANLGIACMRLGRYQPATEYSRQALELFKAAGDPKGQARVMANLGLIAKRSGDYAGAADWHRQGLRFFRESGDLPGELSQLAGLALIEQRLGHYAEAMEHYGQSLELSRRAGHDIGTAYALHGLGVVEGKAGRYAAAREHLNQALAMQQALRNRGGEASLLDELGSLHLLMGEPGRAAEQLERALAIVRELGDADSEAWVRNGLGEAATASGRAADAVTQHEAAHTLAERIGMPDQHARAHAGLGRAHRALGDRGATREHLERAATLYDELGMPEGAELRAELDPPESAELRAEVGIPGAEVRVQVGTPEGAEVRAEVGPPESAELRAEVGPPEGAEVGRPESAELP